MPKDHCSQTLDLVGRLCFRNFVRASRKGISYTHKQMNFRESCCVVWLVIAEM